jgi:hypothetical protein
MKRRPFLQNTAAAVGLGLAGMLQQALAAEPAASRQGIRQLRGTVLVNGKPARLGMRLQPEDTVATDADSEVTFVIGADAFLQRAESRVQVPAATGVSVFRISIGALLGVFGRGPKAVEMPTGHAGIRGTGCYVKIEPRRTYFCLCYGSVDLTPHGGAMRSYSTRRHESPFWIEQGTLSRAEVIDHSDAELVLLESLVGRRPPFPGPY